MLRQDRGGQRRMITPSTTANKSFTRKPNSPTDPRQRRQHLHQQRHHDRERDCDADPEQQRWYDGRKDDPPRALPRGQPE
jgi:hypothetical protein